MLDLQHNLDRTLRRFAGFLELESGFWAEVAHCPICLGDHMVRVVSIVQPGNLTGAERYHRSPVRLSGGTKEVWLSFHPTCALEPFRNLTSLLVRECGLSPVGEYQVFDSIDQILNAIKKIPGHLFEWGGAEFSPRESWELDTGRLLKMHYQRDWDSPVVDFAIELNESEDFKSGQFGLTGGRFGVLLTLWGSGLNELEVVCDRLQSAIESSAQILRRE